MYCCNRPLWGEMLIVEQLPDQKNSRKKIFIHVGLQLQTFSLQLAFFLCLKQDSVMVAEGEQEEICRNRCYQGPYAPETCCFYPGPFLNFQNVTKQRHQLGARSQHMDSFEVHCPNYNNRTASASTDRSTKVLSKNSVFNSFSYL